MSAGAGQWVGAPRAKLAAVGFAGLCAAAILARPHLPAWGGALSAAALAAGLLAWLGLLHSSRALYARWLRVAEGIQTLVVTALFGAVYLFVVPLFTALRLPFDPLRLRRRSREESFWIRRARRPVDLESLQRMG